MVKVTVCHFDHCKRNAVARLRWMDGHTDTYCAEHRDLLAPDVISVEAI